MSVWPDDREDLKVSLRSYLLVPASTLISIQTTLIMITTNPIALIWSAFCFAVLTSLASKVPVWFKAPMMYSGSMYMSATPTNSVIRPMVKLKRATPLLFLKKFPRRVLKLFHPLLMRTRTSVFIKEIRQVFIFSKPPL